MPGDPGVRASGADSRAVSCDFGRLVFVFIGMIGAAALKQFSRMPPDGQDS